MKKEILLVVFFLVSVCVVNAQTNKKISESSPAEKTEIVNKQNAEISSKVGGVNSTQATNVATYDFTTGSNKYYGGANAAKEVAPGVWAMIAGDADGNGQIQNSDSEDIWKPANGTSGYSNADFNLNGQVQNNDREDFWKVNNGRGTQVPN